MYSFQEGVFLSQIPEAEAQKSYAHATLNYKTKRQHARNSFGRLPLSYCDKTKGKS